MGASRSISTRAPGQTGASQPRAFGQTGISQLVLERSTKTVANRYGERYGIAFNGLDDREHNHGSVRNMGGPRGAPFPAHTATLSMPRDQDNAPRSTNWSAGLWASLRMSTRRQY